MALQFANVETEYAKNKDLKKEDVEALLNWANKQPHLPKITELQAVLFLQSCYYSNETAKTALDTYFTMKTRCPDFLRGKSPVSPSLKTALENSLGTVLPKKTPEGHSIIFLKLMSANSDTFDFVEHMRYFDMLAMSYVYQEGTSEGHVIVLDMKGTVFGHLTKALIVGPSTVKKFSFYIQEAMPLRLKALHFVNIVPFMDKLLGIIKPFLKMDILDVLHLHNTLDDLLKFVPLDCLPEDYGGSAPSSNVLHEELKSRFSKNAHFFEWDDQQTVDESKRQKKLKSVEDVFGMEGTFKKIEVD